MKLKPQQTGSGALPDTDASHAPLLLIIEDNDDFAMLMSELLEECGYRSRRTATLAEGRSALKSERFDAVLLDLGLPDSRGLMTWEVIRADDPAVPIIMVTGQNDRALAMRALRSGAQDYIVKTDLDGEELDRAIRFAIERQGLLLEALRARDEAAELALRQSVLARIGRLVSSTDDLEAVFSQVSVELALLLQFDRLALNLIDWNKQAFAEFLVYGEDFPDRSAEFKHPLDGSVTEQVAQLGECILIDESEMHRIAKKRPSAQHMLSRGYSRMMVAPLISQNRRLGALFVASKTSSAYGPAALSLVREVADHMAGAIGQLQARHSAVKLAERQSAVAALGRSLTRSLDLNEVLAFSGPFINQLVPADYVAVNLASEDEGTFKEHYLSDRPCKKLSTDIRPMAGSVTAQVMTTRRILNLREEFSRPSSRRKYAIGALADSGVKAGLAVPLVVGNKAMGAIIWLDSDPERFTDFDLDIAVTVSIQVAGAIANARLHQRTIDLAKETEERVRLEAANRELAISNEIKSQVISNVSHELRTPLTSMLVFADLMHRNRQGNLTGEQLIQTGMIRRGGRLLDLLINDLLTMSRLNSGAFKLDLTEFTVAEVLDDLANIMQSVTETKHQAIRIEAEDRGLEVVSDPSRISQILCNLVSNASKYSPDGSEINVRTWQDEGSLCVSVADQGAGIPASEHEAIFRRFHRIDNDATRSEQGTGLGLHIVQSLLHLLGGSISVESEPGLGSIFTVRIPLRQDADGMTEAA